MKVKLQTLSCLVTSAAALRRLVGNSTGNYQSFLDRFYRMTSTEIEEFLHTLDSVLVHCQVLELAEVQLVATEPGHVH